MAKSIDYDVVTLPKHHDPRGYLVEFLKHPELPPKYRPFGQIYFVTFAKKGTVRGNHYHTKTEEWFGVAQGSLRVVLENVRTLKRKTLTLKASERHFVRLHIGLYTAHAFQSLTPTAVLLDYANKEYDRYNTDRHPYGLIRP